MFQIVNFVEIISFDRLIVAERISEYIAELRKVTQFCDFGLGLTDALCDRLV